MSSQAKLVPSRIVSCVPFRLTEQKTNLNVIVGRATHLIFCNGKDPSYSGWKPGLFAIRRKLYHGCGRNPPCASNDFGLLLNMPQGHSEFPHTIFTVVLTCKSFGLLFAVENNTISLKRCPAEIKRVALRTWTSRNVASCWLLEWVQQKGV